MRIQDDEQCLAPNVKTVNFTGERPIAVGLIYLLLCVHVDI